MPNQNTMVALSEVQEGLSTSKRLKKIKLENIYEVSHITAIGTHPFQLKT